jgi:23S rRNA (uracil1939-C5)-methyltransferase
MANFFKPSSKKQSAGKFISVEITRLDPNGCGVGTYQNKPVFIENTLVDEKVTAKVFESKNKYSKASVTDVLQASPFRITPHCKHFKQCGGCDLQHLSYSEHVPFKQKKVTDLFARHNIINNLPWQTPIVEEQWHYRRKARIGVQYNKLGEPIVGFRQKQSNTLIKIKHCPVLVAPVSKIFVLLEKNIRELSLAKSVGHIEVIYTESISIVIRQLVPLNEHDKELWLACAQTNEWNIYIDNGKSVLPLNTAIPLQYQLMTDSDLSVQQSLAYNVDIHFEPNDFIQVNHQVNQKMVYQALQWLALNEDDQVLDLFCGLGNFSLPIAQNVQQVVGVEGMQSMVDKAAYNAKQNGLTNAKFFQADLNSEWMNESWAKINYTKLLLDPARAGAYEALNQLLTLDIKTIVYVSCDPASLAKDSQLLIENGYTIEKISIMDMFVHTKHIETMVLFTKL